MKTSCLILLLIFPIVFFSNATNIDSLKNIVLSKNSTPEQVSDVCLRIGLNYIYSDYNQDSCKKYANIGLHAAENGNYPQGKLKNLIILGISEKVKENYSAADSLFSVAYNTPEINKQTIEYTNLLIQYGVVKEMVSNYNEALSYYFEGVRIAESRKDSSNMASLFNNIGIIYDWLEESESSISYYRSAAEIFKKQGNMFNYANNLLNIAIIYRATNKTDSVKFILPDAINAARKSANYSAVYSLLTIKGNLDFDKNKYEEAIRHYNEAVLALDSLNNDFKKNRMLGHYHFDVGKVEFKLERYKAAVISLNKSVEYNLLGENKTTLKDDYQYLADCYITLNQPEKAISFIEKKNAIELELMDKQNSKEIARIEYDYELEKQKEEQKIKELELSKQIKISRIIGASIGVLLLLGLLVIYLLYINRKRKISEAKLTKDNLTLKLENKEKEVTTNVLYLLKKNEFLAKLTDTLQELNNKIIPENKTYIRRIIQDIERNTFKDSWEEFEKRFQEVHVDFYKNLSLKHPDLTPNELKLSAFLKLNMTSKDISSITNQSVDSLKVARYRLRKKIGLAKGENLIAFLAKY